MKDGSIIKRTKRQNITRKKLNYLIYLFPVATYVSFVEKSVKSKSSQNQGLGLGLVGLKGLVLRFRVRVSLGARVSCRRAYRPLGRWSRCFNK